MAEGHAVHGIAQRLRQLVGQPVRSRSPHGAFAAEVFDRHVIADAQAVGKHLLVTAVGVEPTVHLHLAMDGAVSVRRHARALDGDFPRTEPPVHGNRPVTSFINDDLPQPEGPTTAANSPGATLSVVSSRASVPSGPP